MRGRPRVFIANISVFNPAIYLPAVFLFALMPSYAYAKSGPQAVIEKVSETSKPVFEDKGPEPENVVPEKKRKFLEKIRGDREDFFEEQQERRRKLFEKLRDADMDEEKRQKKLTGFHAAEIKKTQKFLRKQQKKLDKNKE